MFSATNLFAQTFSYNVATVSDYMHGNEMLATSASRAVVADRLSATLINSYMSNPTLASHATNTTWRTAINDFVYKKSDARFALKLIKPEVGYDMQSFSLEVTARVSYLLFNPNTNPLPTTNNFLNELVTLKASYDSKTGKLFTEADFKSYEWAFAIGINQITVSNPEFANLFALEIEIDQERYLKLNNTNFNTGMSLSASNLTFEGPNKDKIRLAFTGQPIANEYDVEWRYVDRYHSEGTDLTLQSYVKNAELFRFDASRVTIKELNYTINNIFGVGDILFRVRPVAYTLNEAGEPIRIPFEWTNIVWVTNTYASTTASLGSQHLPKFNWQYVCDFSEEGKRKEVITYFDGSLRSRQTLTQLNALDVMGTPLTTTVAQDQLYDYNGRPAIQVLPVPLSTTQLTYQSGLNRNANNEIYGKQNFDDDGATSCVATTDPMNSSAGAGRYYSTASGFNSTMSVNFQNYVPIANGFPFVQTVYTPDNTGKVAATSAPGNQHFIGSGKETKYYYLRPNQVELDRLFGNEIGYAEHYLKEVVVDANGQASISYKNAAGKVIATSLTGNNPNGLNPLNSYVPGTYVEAESVETDLMNGGTGGSMLNENSLVNEYSFYVATPAEYKFHYSTSLDTIKQSNCNTVNFCFDCVYNLSLSLTNECGVEQFYGSPTALTTPAPYTTIIGNVPSESNTLSCSNASGFNLFQSSTDGYITVLLSPGLYTLKKVLSLHETSLAKYKEEALKALITNPACSTLAQFKTDALAKLDIDDCDLTCAECLQKINLQPNHTSGQRQAAYYNFPRTYFNTQTPTEQQVLEANTLFNSIYESCNSLCNIPKLNICDNYLEILKSDLRPGGQYAKYKTNSSGQLEADDEKQTNSGTIYDEYNLLSTRVSGGGYTNNLGFILANSFGNKLITVNGVQRAVKSLTTDEFVKNFQEEWLDELVVRHPEYCEYQKCSLQNTIDKFETELLNIETYAEAFAKNYVNDPTAVEITKPADIDPLFSMPPPSAKPLIACPYPISEMNNRLNNYLTLEQFVRSNGIDIQVRVINQGGKFKVFSIPGNRDLGEVSSDRDNVVLIQTPGVFSSTRQIVLRKIVDYQTNQIINKLQISNAITRTVRMTDLPLIQINCSDFTGNQTIGLIDCIGKSRQNFNSSQFGCTDVRDLYWQQFKMIYLSNRDYIKKTTNLNSQCNCSPPPAIFASTIDEFKRKESRFNPHLGSSGSVTTFQDGSLIDPRAEINLIYASSTRRAKHTILEDGVKQEMANMCEETCDSYIEFWTEKLNACGQLSQSKIDAILVDLKAICKGGCDERNPYGASTLPPNSTATLKTFHDVLVHHNVYDKGVCDELLMNTPMPYNHDYLAEINPEKDTCACAPSPKNQFFDGTVSCPQLQPTSTFNCDCNNNTKIKKSTKQVINFYKEIPDDRKCKTCITCADIAPHFIEFTNYYSSINELNNSNYPILLTNYLNNKLNMNLDYFDYKDMILQCGQTGTGPASFSNFIIKFNAASFTSVQSVPSYIEDINKQHQPVLMATNKASQINQNLLMGRETRFISPVNETFADQHSFESTRKYEPVFSTSLNLIDAIAPPESKSINRIQTADSPNPAKCGCDKIFEIIKANPDFTDEEIENEFTQKYNNGEPVPNFDKLKQLCCLSANNKKIDGSPTTGGGAGGTGDPFDNDDYYYGSGPDFDNQPGEIPELGGELGSPCEMDDIDNFTWSSASLTALEHNFSALGISFPTLIGCVPFSTSIDNCACDEIMSLKEEYDALSPNKTFEEFVKTAKGVNDAIPNLSDILDICNQVKSSPEPGVWSPSKAQRINELFKESGYTLPKEFGCPPPPPENPDPVVVNPPSSSPPVVYCDAYITCAQVKTLFNQSFTPAGLNHKVINQFTFSKYKNQTAAWNSFRTAFLTMISYPGTPAGCVKRINISRSGVICGGNDQTNYLYLPTNAATESIDFLISYMLMYSCGCPLVTYNLPAPISRTNCETCSVKSKNLQLIEDYLNSLSATALNSRSNQFIQPNPPLPVNAYSDAFFTALTNPTVTVNRITDDFYMESFYQLEVKATDPLDNTKFISQRILLNFTTSHPENLFGRIREFFDIKPICAGNGMINAFEAKVKIQLYPPFISSTAANPVYVFKTVRGRILNSGNVTQVIPALFVEYPCCVVKCNRPDNTSPVLANACEEQINTIADANASLLYNEYLRVRLADIERRYINKCLNGVKESLKMKYKIADYHYTLYYYDQAGNLIKTVPPEGVRFLSGTILNEVPSRRSTNNTASSHKPAHTLVTTYRYNTLNQLIWQQTPDAGISHFYYDDLGRIVFSQNAKQLAANARTYSYTKYDNLGRITEVGEVITPSAVSHANARITSTVSSLINNGTRRQITRTYYDAATVDDGLILAQKHLLNRVSKSTYQDFESTVSASNIQHSTLYSYDVHGNVNVLARRNHALEAFSLNQDVKTIHYQYDLISGKVNSVVYQQGEADQYIHHYKYDAENRLIQVFTGERPELLKEDAAYFYYLHGPLARVELGDHLSQGVDYAYTIQGWLKAVNGVSLLPSRDMGRDGDTREPSNLHKYTASDEFGFELNYYSGDYSPAGILTTSANYYLPNKTGSVIETAQRQLFNGNINSMTTSIKRFMLNDPRPLHANYRYDQLNRISSATYYNNYDAATHAWQNTGAQLNDYYNAFTYDANGNILTQVRRGAAITGADMDDLTYRYYSGTNRLQRVEDAVGHNRYADDVDAQTGNNYTYDAIGNLISDANEQIQEIRWNVYGKISAIIRTTGSSKPNLQFEYTPDGHRAVKIVLPVTGSPEYTYYVRDAQGNIMATYSRKMEKVINYDDIQYADLNSRLIAQVGLPAFGQFISSLHGTGAASSALRLQLHTAFKGMTNLSTVIKELQISNLLQIPSSPYRNWLLTTLPTERLIRNHYLAPGTFSNGSAEAYITTLVENRLREVIASHPDYFSVFVYGLCEYDIENNTTYAQDLQAVLSFGLCPYNSTVQTDINYNLNPNRPSGSRNIQRIIDFLAPDEMGDVVVQSLLLARRTALSKNNQTIINNLYSLIAAKPTFSTRAKIANYCSCGTVDIEALDGDYALLAAFMQALLVKDNAAYTAIVDELQISNDPGDLENDLSTIVIDDLVNALNNANVGNCTELFKQTLEVLSLINRNAFDNMLGVSGFLPAVNISCVDDFQAFSVTGQTPPINDVILQQYSINEIWQQLLAVENLAHYADWYFANATPHYISIAAKNNASTVASHQQTNEMYGTNYTTSMFNYTKHIEQYFGNTVYNNLVEHYLKESSVYDDSVILSEQMMYGSSRLGTVRQQVCVSASRLRITNNIPTTISNYQATLSSRYSFERGKKQFELSNHLGNVLATVTDKKLQAVTYFNNFDGFTDNWKPLNASSDVQWEKVTTDAYARVTSSAAGAGMGKVLKTETGVAYTVSFKFTGASVTAIQAQARQSTTANPFGGSVIHNLAVSSNGTYTFNFTATGTQTALTFSRQSGSGAQQHFRIDDVLVYKQVSGQTAPERYYQAEVLSATDYSPFGAPMPTRSYSYNKRDAVVVSQNTCSGGNCSSQWEPRIWVGGQPTNQNTGVTITEQNDKLVFSGTKRYSQIFRNFETVPGRVYKLSFKLTNSTMPFVNVSVFSPIARQNILEVNEVSTFGKEMILTFTATESTTSFYLTKGWSATAITAQQEVTLDYLYIQEQASQQMEINCGVLAEVTNYLLFNGINMSDSVIAKTYLNHYFKRNLSYAAYQSVNQLCQTNQGSFVLMQPGVEYEEVRGYRFGYQNQERDNETGWSNYKHRMHDPRTGRFFAVDPLTKYYPWNSPYAFSENRVTDSRELEGLERVSIHNYSFAPFDDFGGGFHGDGENRRFGDKVNPGVKLKENFRIGSRVTLNLTGEANIERSVYGSWSLWAGDADFSAAKFESFIYANGNLNYHYSGGNAEPILVLQPFVADIDVKLNITFKQMADNKNKFQVTGSVKGDRFPSNETYLTDVAGNKLFIGVSGPDGMFNESIGPMTELNGSGEERMQQFNFFILFNADNTFKGVSLSNGTFYELADWNKIFTNLNPQDQNIGTNITNDKIETDYDPD